MQAAGSGDRGAALLEALSQRTRAACSEALCGASGGMFCRAARLVAHGPEVPDATVCGLFSASLRCSCGGL